MANKSYQNRMAKNAWAQYVLGHYKAQDIFSAYGRPSTAKIRAWKYCEQLCAEKDGRGLVVMSANTFRFSAGFEFTDPETGAVNFCYISPDYDAITDDFSKASDALGMNRTEAVAA